MLPIPCQLRVLTNIPPADKKIKEPFRTPLFFLRRERDSRAPTSLRSPTSNAHTLPRASCATQNEEVAQQLSFLYLSTFPFNKLMSMCLYTKKRALSDSFFILCCGERGIRTPGTSQFNGFQDRRNRPLCHLSFCFIKTEKKCAQDETRTHTVLRPLPPQSSVYTNFTTCALLYLQLF